MHKLPTNLLVICSQQSDWTSSLFSTEKTPPWHNIQNKHQWGFRPQRSTLLYMTESWGKAIDSGKVVGILFIDFKKAFDSVSHQILLKKLSACGVSGGLPFLPWELSSRPQAKYHCWQSHLKRFQCWLRCTSRITGWSLLLFSLRQRYTAKPGLRPGSICGWFHSPLLWQYCGQCHNKLTKKYTGNGKFFFSQLTNYPPWQMWGRYYLETTINWSTAQIWDKWEKYSYS